MNLIADLLTRNSMELENKQSSLQLVNQCFWFLGYGKQFFENDWLSMTIVELAGGKCM